jgi:hypothetical protein
MRQFSFHNTYVFLPCCSIVDVFSIMDRSAFWWKHGQTEPTFHDLDDMDEADEGSDGYGGSDNGW